MVKKRLAYSTISQISYIMFSLSLMTEDGLKGGLLQLISHMSAKGCLFLAAGVFIFVLDAHRVEELKGIGRQLPVTMWCFMIASLSLVGIPPMGGFTSKWKIASAALSGGPGVFAVLGPVVLLISALLTAGYLFPVVINAFFPGIGSPEEIEEEPDEFTEEESNELSAKSSEIVSGKVLEEEPDEFSEDFSEEDYEEDSDEFREESSEEDFEEKTEDTIEEKEFAEPGVLMDGAMIVLCIAALLAGLFGAGIVGGLVL